MWAVPLPGIWGRQPLYIIGCAPTGWQQLGPCDNSCPASNRNYCMHLTPHLLPEQPENIVWLPRLLGTSGDLAQLHLSGTSFDGVLPLPGHCTTY